MHRWTRPVRVRILFETTSRLGNGGIWFACGALLWLVDGESALPVIQNQALGGGLGLAVYKAIKRLTGRLRPFELHGGLAGTVAPLDRYSFPSGHTLHAVCQSLVICGAYPPAAWLLGPFTLLTMVSRVGLGLHFPTDVIAGTLLGTGIAHLLAA